jgi:Flp pilus assembly protein TadG
LIKHIERLRDDKDGNFAIMTALLAVPLILSAGLAIDYTAASSDRANMQQVADSASLAGGQVYDGTNSSAAIAVANEFLKGYSTKLPPGASFNVTFSGQTVKVDITGNSTPAFMKIAGVNQVPLQVSASALAPLKPKTVLFKPTKSQGWYYKKVSIMVVRPKSSAEVVVGTVTYQPTTHEDGGQGDTIVSPSETIELGKYTALILKMEIKEDGCPLKKAVKMKGQKVTCDDSSTVANSKYNLTLRTDNPDQSYYLFVDGKQLPKGVTTPLDGILVCDKTSNHAWEDGGGFERQDFFYTAKTTCAPDGQFVRLTQ